MATSERGSNWSGVVLNKRWQQVLSYTQLTSLFDIASKVLVNIEFILRFFYSIRVTLRSASSCLMLLSVLSF